MSPSDLRTDDPLRRIVSAPTTLRREFRSGSELVLTDDAYWFLASGDVVVRRAGRPVEVWVAPAPLDLAGTVTRRRETTFVALGDVVVHGIPTDALTGTELASALASESERLWARIEADARRDDDTFLPGAVPVPGPWWFRGARAAMLVMQGDPVRIASLLPRGVRMLPGTGGRYLVALTRFDDVGSLDPRDGSRFAYHEVTPFLPVWSGVKGPAAFVPELYPDAWMAVILGREIHGFPKRTARIGFREDGGEVLLDRGVALRARWTRREAMDPTEAMSALGADVFGRPELASVATSLAHRVAGRFAGRVRPPMAALVHKRIGDPRTSGATFAIDELVRVPLEVDPITRAERLPDATVEANGEVLHGTLVSAYYVESGFRFGPGHRERSAT